MKVVDKTGGVSEVAKKKGVQLATCEDRKLDT
jgi:hypothetical protein